MTASKTCSTDERINFLFDNSDIDNLKFQLTEQICQLAGGPVRL